MRAKQHPVQCPAGQLCRCAVPEAVVLDALKGDVATLRAYYDAALDVARKTHGFLRPCPGQGCGKAIDMHAHAQAQAGGGSAGLRLSGSLGVHCEHCRQDWCSSCWLPAHAGVACEDFAGLKQRWMAFVAAQGRVSEEVEAELRNFRDLCASEQFNASVMRHCPHCGLVTYKVGRG